MAMTQQSILHLIVNWKVFTINLPVEIKKKHLYRVQYGRRSRLSHCI